MFDPDQTYSVSIETASLEESSKGTPGLTLRLSDGESTIYHTLWLSEAAKVRSRQTLEDLGVDPNALRTPEFWNDPQAVLAGKRASIVTKSEAWGGDTRTRVKWLNGPQAAPKASAAPPNLAAKLAASFADMEEVPF